jgi:hypothetical protein
MKELLTLSPYLRRYRAGIAAGLALVVVANAFAILGPRILGMAIDALEAPGVTAATIAAYAGLVVLVALLGGAARFGMRRVLNAISRRVETDLRDDFFDHLLRLDAGFYSRQRTGDLMSRATNDVQAVRQAAGPAVMYLVNTLAITVFALAFMLAISPRLTLYALIPMAALPPIVLVFGRMIHVRFERIQEQLDRESNELEQLLAARSAPSQPEPSAPAAAAAPTSGGAFAWPAPGPVTQRAPGQQAGREDPLVVGGDRAQDPVVVGSDDLHLVARNERPNPAAQPHAPPKDADAPAGEDSGA